MTMEASIEISTPLKSLRQLRGHVSRYRRWQLLALTILTIFGAVLEIVALGSVVPLIAMITRSGTPEFGPIGFGGLVGKSAIWLPQTAASWAFVFCVVVLVSALFRALLSLAIYRFSFGLGHELSISIYRNTLYQPYSYHTQANSSELLACVDKCNAAIFNVLLPLLNMSTALAMSTAIVVGLLLIDARTAMAAAVVFSALYALILRFTRKRMLSNSDVIASTQITRIKSLQEGLGGIRDILLDHSQPVFLREFTRYDQNLRKAQISSNFLGNAPRFLIEAVGMVLIAALAVSYDAIPGSNIGSLAALSALALGAQRLLPQLQQIYYGWASLRSHHAGLVDVVEFLERRVPDEYADPGVVPKIVLNQSVELRGVRFRYPMADQETLRGVNLTIAKGARIGIVGKTGSGKSTLIDVLMGLHLPSAGNLLIDGSPLTGKAMLGWRSAIAHVPQQIHLSDSTIAENIAFGLFGGDVDMCRVREAASKAQVADVIESMQDGYMTMVGERGVRLSGGQRQRLGLARAFYKAPELLVLDEATSALDDVTERLVMDAVFNQADDLTVVMIAHRTSTLERCDLVYEVVDGVCRPYRGVLTPAIGSGDDRD